MHKLLYIQFRNDVSAVHELSCFLDKTGLDSYDIKLLNSIDQKFPSNDLLFEDVSAVLLGGSGQFDLSKNPKELVFAKENTSDMFDYIFANDIPTFGVCLSHQLIAQLLGSEVKGVPETAENGMLDVQLTAAAKNDKLFRDIPSVFKGTQAHKDTVQSLPKDCTLMLTNSIGTIEGFRYKENIYTVQFHPELAPADIEYRWSLYPEYLKSKSSEEIEKMKSELVDTPYAARILRNFVDFYLKAN